MSFSFSRGQLQTRAEAVVPQFLSPLPPSSQIFTKSLPPRLSLTLPFLVNNVYFTPYHICPKTRSPTAEVGTFVKKPGLSWRERRELGCIFSQKPWSLEMLWFFFFFFFGWGEVSLLASWDLRFLTSNMKIVMIPIFGGWWIIPGWLFRGELYALLKPIMAFRSSVGYSSRSAWKATPWELKTSYFI